LTELAELERGGLIRVGSHTVSHPSLGRLFIGDQRVEIEEGKRRLEKALGHPVDTFAYPFGTYRDYTADTVRLIKEAGFQCACANFAGPVQCGIDPFQLPRYVVHDWDGEEFGRRLGEWMWPRTTRDK
jgi:peptidoglycan/xylan/chitin deacetylase (PgdA/CDA1 family)